MQHRKKSTAFASTFYFFLNVQCHLRKNKKSLQANAQGTGQTCQDRPSTKKNLAPTCNVEILKYKIIRTNKQYYQYCDMLEVLSALPNKAVDIVEEIVLLSLLIQNYDNQNIPKKRWYILNRNTVLLLYPKK